MHIIFRGTKILNDKVEYLKHLIFSNGKQFKLRLFSTNQCDLKVFATRPLN